MSIVYSSKLNLQTLELGTELTETELNYQSTALATNMHSIALAYILPEKKKSVLKYYGIVVAYSKYFQSSIIYYLLNGFRGVYQCIAVCWWDRHDCQKLLQV